MDARSGFRLTDADRAALAVVAAQERQGRWLGGFAVLLGLGLVPLLVVFGEPGQWWYLIPAVICALITLVGGLTLLFGQGGAAGTVLAGAAPTVTAAGVMSDVGGDAPLGWSMILDETIDGTGYAHFGDGDPDWLRREGARVRLSGFGRVPGHRFDGVSLVESADGHRHWVTGRTANRRRHISADG